MSKHGLPDHLLCEYVSGALDADFEVLVASHLTLSTASHQDLRLHQDIGGLMLSQLPIISEQEPQLPPSDVIDSLIDQSRPPRRALELPVRGSGMPEPLVNYLQAIAGTANLSELEWYSYYFGIDRAILTEGPDGVRARILRCQPGSKFPVHGHGSEEISLVLQGAYTDETGRYVCGDVQCVPAEETHGPIVDKDELCYVLVVSELPAVWIGDTASL